ncbi:UbiA prenyltransferase [Daedalea quercina L-15889]|uniref:UbiA prenyltransferase n=1 Tax=Daedalea quercina L-15889 TaxID=1314783 RepID=A0A165PRU1_9APHY|nr:UbiA prenyltransferase [Daedalea quercina L-15889]
MSKLHDSRTTLPNKANVTKAKPKWRHLLELTRMHAFPDGMISVFWPCVWGYVLASRNDPPDPYTFIRHIVPIFVSSGFVYSAAAVINDICDREFDRHVERCKNRPIASGAVTVTEATILLIALAAPPVWMLTFVNRTAMISGLIGIFPLHGIYPLLKRWTSWPPAWSGLAMTWGYPTAWLIVAPQDIWSPMIWTLTLGGMCWIILTDTEYHCQDRKDDVKAGIPSTAILFGSYIRVILSIFATIYVAALTCTGIAANMPPVYFIVVVAGTAVHLLWQLLTLNPDDPANCLTRFSSNRDLGGMITAGMIAGVYLSDLLKS